MKTLVAKFTFTIPEDSPHEDAGKKVEKAFEYKECETDSEAMHILAEKKWSLRSLVNDTLKINARSSAYQAALLPYKPSEVAPEDIKERMIRDYIRLGVSEEMARKQVEALLNAK